MSKEFSKKPKRQEQAYVSNRGISSPDQLRQPYPQSKDHSEALTKKLGRLQKSIRPSVFTRPSNDDFTNLARVGPANGGSSTNSLVLPMLDESGYQTPIKQQNERLPMTIKNPSKNLWRVASICTWLVSTGFSDAGPGALLPHIEKYYNINYTLVSLIWISQAIGFIVIAVFAHKIQPWLGKDKSIPVGCVFSIIMYAIVLSGGPYPLIVVGFFFNGLGLANVLAQANIFLSKLDKSSLYLSYFHGTYGLGATISPLIATTMVNNGIKWHYFYLIILGMMTCNAVNTWFAFKNADVDLKPWDDDEDIEHFLKNDDDSNESVHNRAREVNNSSDEEEHGIALTDLGPHLTSRQTDHHSDKSEMILALKHPITWLISFWVLFYQGGEVAIGGWIVTYLQDYRNANSSSGYVASGFWGGLTVGRLALTRPLHTYLGARISVTLASMLTIVFVILTWVIPNVITAGVFVSLAGMLIGPNYPLMITAVTQGMIPRKIEVVSLTIMTAFGSSGGALFPFIVGLISQSAGTYVVLPIFIALWALLLILWICLPNIEKRKKKGSNNLTLWEKFW